MRFKALAPAGGFPSPYAFVRALAAASGSADVRLTVAFRQRFALSDAVLTGSGKEALLQVFNALPRRPGRTLVAVSAYTCPDIAAAAVRAGYRVLPLDVDPATLDLAPLPADDPVLERIAAVVLSNLYGLPDDLEPWLTLSAAHGFAVVDDACQALWSARNGVHVGAEPGVIGVASFGRGKAICGAGGGAVLKPRGHAGMLSVGEVHRPAGVLRELLDQLVLFASWLLERPRLYRLPESLPFLGLGRTECRLDFPLEPLSTSRIAAALAQVGREPELLAELLAASHRYQTLLTRGCVHPLAVRAARGSAVLIRYPILLGSASARDAALAELTQRGLGASRSYPGPLGAYPELREHLEPHACPGAEAVSMKIVTLPVHPYVTPADQDAIAEIINRSVERVE